MNCIDAIEGTAKRIVLRLHQIYIQERLDDTEYIRYVRAVTESTEGFLRDNSEIVAEPSVLRQVLKEHARELWLKNIEGEDTDPALPGAGREKGHEERTEYYRYYFDYIYENGVYPP